ncbi:MAG: hypothetical protein V4726_16410 [Verrucomicrobiota bacterium]
MRWRFFLKFPAGKLTGFGLLLTGFSLMTAGCGTARHGGPEAVLPAPSRVTRSEVMETARRYASHKWRGTAANVRHGTDSAGIRIDTPDVTFQRTGAMPGFWAPEVMETARRYASHKWRGTAANVRHGTDSAGIRIDTPDVTFQRTGAMPGFWAPGVETFGIPYQWGGFCTPEEFDRGIARGLAAGDVYTGEKRRLLDDAVSREAVGIDCSGYVSRCWKLPRSFSTRELASLCDPLPSWEDLRPGDVLNTWNSHVILFSGWMDAEHRQLSFYETGGPPDWKVIRHRISRAYLEKKRYRPLRYRGIRES